MERGGVSGWIEELFVSAQWRGQGIGSRLIEEVVARAKEAGWRALDLEVDATHPRAKACTSDMNFDPFSGADFTEFWSSTLRLFDSQLHRRDAEEHPTQLHG